MKFERTRLVEAPATVFSHKFLDLVSCPTKSYKSNKELNSLRTDNRRLNTRDEAEIDDAYNKKLHHQNVARKHFRYQHKVHCDVGSF